MRVAYACRSLVSDSATGMGARAFAAATAMAAAGHEVYLISEGLAEPWEKELAGYDGLRWRPLLPERRDHLYFTERHSYADRLYDTVLALHAEAPLDVVDAPDAGGEALTLLRAKRLLGQLPDTCVAVSLHPESAVDSGSRRDWPTSFAEEMTAYAEAYSRTHADRVLFAGRADAGLEPACGSRARRQLPGLPDLGPLPCPESDDVTGDAPLTVVWLGPIRPGAGLDVLLRALALAHQQEPRLRLVGHGADSLTDPVGGSYWRHLHASLDEPLRQAVTFDGPVRVQELASLPAPGAQCVLARGTSGSAAEAVLAMASGYSVIAPAGSVGADLLRETRAGGVVVQCAAAELAGALVGGVRTSAAGVRRALASAQAVRNLCSSARVAARLEEIYGSGSEPAAAYRPPGDRPVAHAETVSVVIPLFNQGAFLPAALESVRNSGLVEPEIIVVDDGSTETETLSILRTTAGVTHVRQPHRGLSAARNRGIAAAHGSLVLVLDADDMVAPGFLPAAVGALGRCRELAFVAGYVRYFGLLDLVYVPAGPVGALSLVLHTHLKSTVLYRREALERVGGYDEKLPAFEDWEIQIRLAQAGEHSDVLPIVGQLYRRHAGSMSFSASNGMRSELVQYLVRKHAASLTKAQLIGLLENLVDLWKTGYEPSRSVLLQRAGWVGSGPVDAG